MALDSDGHDAPPPPAVIGAAALGDLVTELGRRGWRVIGPTREDDAIVLREIVSVDELPQGWTADQAPGSYRLRQRGDDAWFGFAAGPDSWKAHLFPPRRRLFRAERGEDGLSFEAEVEEPPPTAFLGVRACDLAAIGVLGRVRSGGGHPDPDFAARRSSTLVIAVNCGSPAEVCFCVSMGTGPRVTAGADLVLTELLEGEHRFLVEVGSGAGAELLEAVTHEDGTAADLAAADAVVARSEQRIGRSLDTDRLPELLAANLDHPRWDDVAERCLSCANCTMACPTCFCTTVEDVTDLTGATAERWQRWDSCFSLDHSAIHGGAVRSTVRSRYRQWLTHKLGTWHDQFGESGCVGCGRCITWCPVGIDLTEEVRAIRTEPADATVPSPGRSG